MPYSDQSMFHFIITITIMYPKVQDMNKIYGMNSQKKSTALRK